MTRFNKDEIAVFFEYLDDLRLSGVTNMFGAGTYVQEDFSLSREEAKSVVLAWMHTFSKGSLADRVVAALATELRQ